MPKASGRSGRTRRELPWLRREMYGNNEILSKGEGSLRVPVPSDDHNERPVI